jgi:6-phosphogluconolactonase
VAFILGEECPLRNQNGGATFVYVGAYTGFGPNRRGKAEGIDLFRLDPTTGALTHVETTPGVENPSFLTVDPTRRFLYAVNGSPSIDGRPGGAVSAFAIDQETGHLTFINRQMTTGQGPCHATIDRAGRYVLATSYHAGNVVVFPTRPDGGLAPACDLVQHHGSSVNPDRQDRPHAHAVNFDLAERFALVCDLGLDRVFVYRFNHEAGELIPNDPPWSATEPGVGPRHLAVHPTGRYVFVINEIGSSLSSYRYDPDRGALSAIETVPTIPADFVGTPFTPDVQVGPAASRPPVVGTNFAADVHVAPSGRFVYGSNRGHDSIVVYAFDEATERMTCVGYVPTGGRTPRNFTIDPTGTLLLVANQGSDTIVSFRIDPTTGTLAPTGDVASSPTPTCVRIVTMT